MNRIPLTILGTGSPSFLGTSPHGPRGQRIRRDRPVAWGNYYVTEGRLPFIQITIAEAHDAATSGPGVSAGAAQEPGRLSAWISRARTWSALILPTQHETPGLFSRIRALFGELTIQPNVARHRS